VKQRYAQIVQAIQALFAPGDPVLEQFGIHPRKSPAPRTAEQKAVSAAKAALTRKARGTKGSKAKLAIQTVGTPTLTITPTGTDVVPQIVTNGPQAGTPQPAAATNAAGTTPGGSTAPAAT
jgi:hypothetical protein